MGGKPSKLDNSPASTLQAEQTPAPSADILDSKKVNAKGREKVTLAKVEPEYAMLRRLNDTLRTIREASVRYVVELIWQRSKDQDPRLLNSYQPGDWVVYAKSHNKCHPKMLSPLPRPCEIVQQIKNDKQVRNIVTGAIVEFSVIDLEPFFGTRDTALEAARRDHD